MEKRKIAFIVGTRPEIIKVFPVFYMLKENYNKYFTSYLINTGQHKEMIEQMLDVFRLSPDFSLKIMTKQQTISQIVERSIRGLDKIFNIIKPCLVLVQGDTSTALAGALAAYHRKIYVAHIEAGLRSYDKYNPHPEELNRRIIDCVADIHFAPTCFSQKNLISENIKKDTILITGNTVIDAIKIIEKMESKEILLSNIFSNSKTNLNEINKHYKKIILFEIHRRESLGEDMLSICNAIKDIAERHKDVGIIFPVHKNPKIRKNVKFLSLHENIYIVEPIDYISFVHLMKLTEFIITDSGGIQEEAPTLNKPVLVVRKKTERPEVIKTGNAKLVGTDKNKIFYHANLLLKNQDVYKKMAITKNPYGDGKSSKRICEFLMYFFNLKETKPEEFKI